MLLAGCAANQGGFGASWEPVVDVRGDPQARYPTDLAECQQYATRVMNAQQGAVTGAVAGALLKMLVDVRECGKRWRVRQ